jgi:hypothetical protein
LLFSGGDHEEDDAEDEDWGGRDGDDGLDDDADVDDARPPLAKIVTSMPRS